jgi:hypothetical protein
MIPHLANRFAFSYLLLLMFLDGGFNEEIDSSESWNSAGALWRDSLNGWDILPLNQVPFLLASLGDRSRRVERVFDFVIDFNAIDSFATDDQKLTVSVKQLYHIVNPGGYLITCQQTDDPASLELKSPHLWVGQLHLTPLISFPAVEFLGLKRRSVCCNTRAALYWGASGADTSEQAIAQLSRERDILEEVTVTQMVRRGGNYRRYGSHEAPVLKEDSRAPVLRMTSAGRDKAMRALQEHGFCIVRDVFPSQVCLPCWRVSMTNRRFVNGATLLS